MQGTTRHCYILNTYAVGLIVLEKILKVISHYKSRKEGNDQELIQSRTTPDPGHHMGR